MAIADPQTLFDDPEIRRAWFPDAVSVVTVRRADGIIELVPVFADDNEVEEAMAWLAEEYPGGPAQLDAEEGDAVEYDPGELLAEIRARY